MKNLGWLLIFLGLVGCDKKETSPHNALLVGKWQLSEFCVSPGGVVCPRQQATVVFTQTLEFFEDGVFTEKTPQRAQFQTPIVGSGKYRIGSYDYINLKFDDMSLYKKEVQWDYVVVSSATSEEQQLIIRPNVCDEGCEYVYKKVK